MTRLIVGFTGQIGAGKSEAAKELHRIGFTRVRFAGPLKAMMASLGLTEDEIDGKLKEAPCELLCGKTPRFAMQTIGTEWGRDMIGSELWVNAWKRSVSQVPAFIPVVVDDVRFPNEATAIRELGGVLVRVERSGPAASKHASKHASEQMNFDADFVIKNDVSLDAFREEVRAIVQLKRAA